MPKKQANYWYFYLFMKKCDRGCLNWTRSNDVDVPIINKDLINIYSEREFNKYPTISKMKIV